ncbi:DNA polymerase IV [soil metagenome]
MHPAVLCRDCLDAFPAPASGLAARCPSCRSPRTLTGPELFDLAIAHLDCDAFYASVEKRDDPALADRPVIVGGGRRGVVTTACYIARIAGVRSAMPIYRALKLCPEAVVVRPRMAHYVAISGEIRARLLALTPMVEPLSLDEAFLDLSGTARLHGAPPATLLARLQRDIERELGLTVSIGLSHAKYLAKIASDADKPRGFTLIARAATLDYLAPLSLSVLPGVGPTTAAALAADGLSTIADLRTRPLDALIRRHGDLAHRLHALAQGRDPRRVAPSSPAKAISNETTFDADLCAPAALERHLWLLAETVSRRAKAKALAGLTVTLKLKRADHRLMTRRRTLAEPTQSAYRLYETARSMLQREVQSGPFRLIGIGLAGLSSDERADRTADMTDPYADRRLAAERATDRIRAQFGDRAIILGRALE